MDRGARAGGVLTACDDYLSGPGLTDDPNKPSDASTDQLYHAMQVTQYAWHTGDIARHTSMWMQQMAGIGNQTTARDQYEITEQEKTIQVQLLPPQQQYSAHQ